MVPSHFHPRARQDKAQQLERNNKKLLDRIAAMAQVVGLGNQKLASANVQCSATPAFGQEKLQKELDDEKRTG